MGSRTKKLRVLLTLLLLSTYALSCAEEPLAPLTTLPRELSADERELVDTTNSFSLKLLREIQAQAPTENLFLSPFSVAIALTMTYNGAGGETTRAMRDTLGLDSLTLSEVNEAYESLLSLLFELDRTVDLNVANSLWYRRDLQPEDEFVATNESYFDALVSPVDFASPGGASTINSWVRRETNGRIDRVVPDGLSPDAVMYLINAIYFNASWSSQFTRSLTAPRPFLLLEGTETSVESMATAAPVDVWAFSDEDVLVLDIPYARQAFSMTILMPLDPQDLLAVLGELDLPTWSAYVRSLSPVEASIFLPKFRFSYGLELTNALTGLGMGIAFDPVLADFSRLTSGPNNVFISFVLHKAFVEVDEEGTEAAAATAVTLSEQSLPARIAVDRPFLFAIRDRLSGTILFMGLMLDPSLAR